MAFQEAGDRQNLKQEAGGLNLNWENLRINSCPICCDDLVLFEHVDLLKCRCGFKISTNRIYSENFSSGFYIGNYEDETPF